MKKNIFNVLNRSIAFFLIFIMLFIECSSFLNLFVYATDGSAASTQADFLNFYSDSDGSVIEVKNLTSQDYYVLSAFMSNFYKPGETTLAELIDIDNNSAFFDRFMKALNRNESSSFKTQMKSVIKAIGDDTVSAMEAGVCTLYNQPDSTQICSGETFLKNMCAEDTKVEEQERTDRGILSNHAVYINKQSGGGKTMAIKFNSSPYRAAFQTICAYNPNLFLSSAGIQSMNGLFLDTVGNIWGVKIPNDASNKESLEKGLKSSNFTNLVGSIGAKNFYLILPACLNPATFAPGLSKESDMDKMRMPLMNRFVLGCLANVQDFYENSSTKKYIFAEDNIPIYNLLADIAELSNTNKGMAVFGLTTIGESTMLQQGQSSSVTKNQAMANFVFNPDMISLNVSKTDGIGDYGTNSYIIFSPNMLYSTPSEGVSKDSSKNNWNIDMDQGGFCCSNSNAFTVFNPKGTDAKIKDQQRLLVYLYYPTALTLNQVALNFYYQGADSSIVDEAIGATQSYSRVLYEGDEKDRLAAKMGMKGLNLFMSAQSEYTWDLGDGNYKGFAPDNIIHSALLNRLLANQTVTSYVFVDNGSGNIAYRPFLTPFNESTSSILNQQGLSYWQPMTIETGGLNWLSLDTEVYGRIQKGDFKDLEGRGLKVFTDYKNNTFNNSGSWDLSEFYDKNDDGTYKYYIKPKGFVTAGSEDDDVSDFVFARTLGLKEGEGDSTETVLDKTKSLSTDITNSTKTDEVSITINADKMAEFLMEHFGYSVFLPSSPVLKACQGGQPEKVKLFGGTEYTTQIAPSSMGNQQFVMGCYFGYILDMMGISECTEDGIEFNGFNTIFLPKYDISAKGGNMSFDAESEEEGGSGIINSEDLSFEEKQKDLINRIYGMTNDSNNEYRNNWFKNVIEGFVLTIHRTITGTYYSNIDSVSSGNNSTYQSVTGYIYTPTLEELSFTSSIMQNYQKIYVFCMMIVLFILILMVLMHMRSWQQGVITAVIMCVALLFPYILISNTVNISNKISDSIYSDRFDFWAMSQHQQRLSSLTGIDVMNEKDRLLTLSNATSDLTTTGDAGVKIKWMSPKKAEMFKNLYSDASLSDSFITNMEIFKWLFSSFIYDSEFVDTEVAGNFVYRPYNTIALEAKAYYAWGQEIEKTSAYTSTGSYTLDLSGDSLGSYEFKNIPSGYVSTLGQGIESKNYLYSLIRTDEINNGFISQSDGNSKSKLKYSDERLSDIKIIGQKDEKGVYASANKIGLWGSLNPYITNRMTGTSGVSGIGSNLPASPDEDYFEGKGAEQIAKAIYLKNTESPYYYFYSVLRERYGSEYIGNETNEFNKALLRNDLFKISKEESLLLNSEKHLIGAYRDFLDLEGLFAHLIPYMKDSNDYVAEWKRTNDYEVEEFNFQYEVEEDDNGNVTSTTSDGSEGYAEAVQRKNDMNKVWNMYCPWVDSLYDLNVYNKRVTVGNNKVMIHDTLNPSSYVVAGRPMIFSEAEMILRGYTYKDLTDVERRIQAVTEKTYEDLLYLVNYYDMREDVLLSAAAMYATFNFNAEFSQDKFLGQSVMLYPQGFELKNFNYDAFMRLALLNSTGETVFATNDLYERVLAKTSIFTGLLLIVCDLIACIAIPLFKFIILLCLFFLGILICVACVVNPPDKIFEAVNKTMLLPTVLFTALNIGFSYATSFVVGEGLTAYVGSKSMNFSTNDPSMTMLLMIGMGVVYLFFAWKIMKLIIQAYKKFGMSTMLATVGIVGSAIAAGSKGIANKASKMLGKTASGVGRGASAVGGAVVGAAGAEKGKRLAGAFEGGSNGLKGAIKQRIRDNKRQEQMSKQNDDLAEKLDILSKRNKNDNNDNNDNNNGAHKKPPEGIVPAGGVNPDNRTPEEKEEARRKAEEAMAEAKKRKELDKWKEDREYEKLEKEKEKWDRDQENKQKAQENANSNRKKREQQQKAHNDNKARKGNSKKKKGKKKGKKK